MYRFFVWTLTAVALATFCSSAVAAEKKKKDENAAAGVVVSVDTAKITIKSGKQGEKSLDLAANVKVMIKGAEGKLADVKAGDRVKLTQSDGKVSEINVGEGKKKKN